MQKIVSRIYVGKIAQKGKVAWPEVGGYIHVQTLAEPVLGGPGLRPCVVEHIWLQVPFIGRLFCALSASVVKQTSIPRNPYLRALIFTDHGHHE